MTAEERAKWNDEISAFVTAAEESANTAGEAAERAETAKTAAETSATQADTARQGAETARAEAVTAQNTAKVSAAQASASAQQTTADKTATAGYAKTAKTNADSTAADRQAVQDMAAQVTADKATVADNAAQVAEDRTAAETAAQTAQAVADSLPDDYVTAVGKIAENTAEINNTNSNVSQLKGDLDNVKELTIEEEVFTETTNISTNINWTLGYVGLDGHIYTDADVLHYSNKIPVQAGDVLEIESHSFRFVTAYDGETAKSDLGAMNVSTYTVPNGINYLVLTKYTTYEYHIYITHSEVIYKNILEDKIENKFQMGYMRVQGNLNDGESLVLPYHNVKNHNVLIFSANISSFGSLKIGKQTDTYITIDETNVSLTCDVESQNFTVDHGLTIQNNIQVIIENETGIYPTSIRILSSGNEFNVPVNEYLRFLMDEGSPYVISNNSILTDCAFSWTSRHINKPIWLFGDSYFSWYASRWVYYLAQDGFTDSCMLNGYAGEKSADAYPALENLLKVHTPQIVVWCLGMNDPDNADSVNESWKNYYDKVVSLSEKYGFELILYTTPTTPTMNNSFKNEIIRNSGYRYVEADKALRIDNNGNWIDGTLSDNVHPTINGAKLLYHRFLADIPELSNKC